MTDLELINRYNALVERDHTPDIERLEDGTWYTWDTEKGPTIMTTRQAAYQAREALKDWGEL